MFTRHLASRTLPSILVALSTLGATTTPFAASTSGASAREGDRARGGASTGVELVRTVPAPAPAQDLVLTVQNGRTLAVIATDAGTWVVDVTDPDLAATTGVVADAVPRRAVAVTLTVAYTTGESGGLRIDSIDDPDAPSHLVTRAAPARATALAIDVGRSLLFAAHPADGVTAYSITDPLNPVEVGRTDELRYTDLATDPAGLLVSAGTTGTSVHDVTGLVQTPSLGFGWLRLMTHRDAAPAAVAITPGTGRVITLEGVPGGALTVHDRLRTTGLSRVGSLPLARDPLAVPRAVTVIDDLALVADGRAGVELVDLLDPTTPWSVGHHPLGGPDDEAVAVATDGTRVMALGRDTGLHLLSLAPLAATVAGSLTVAGSGAAVSTTTVSVPALDLSVRTAGGAYRLRVPPGTHELHFDREIYAPDSTTITVAAGETVEVDRALTAIALGTVRGSVIRKSERSGSSGPGVPRHPEGTLVTFVGTDFIPVQAFDGVYRRFFTPPDDYLLEANEFGYDPVQARVTVVPGPPVVQDFVLHPSPVTETFEDGAVGWEVDPDGAISGRWILADPSGTGAGRVQPDADETPGTGVDAPRFAFVTGNAATDAGVADDDVDGGCTRLTSPAYDLTGVPDPHLKAYLWFRNDVPTDAETPDGDGLRILASRDDGATWVGLDWLTTPRVPWQELTLPLAPYLGDDLSTVRLRFEACDVGGPSVVEACVDDVSLMSGGELLEPKRLPALTGATVSGDGTTFRARASVAGEVTVARSIDDGLPDPIEVRAVTAGEWIEVASDPPPFDVIGYHVALTTDTDVLEFGPYRVSPTGAPPAPPATGLGLRPTVTPDAVRVAIDVSSSARVRVDVFDVTGRRVVVLLDRTLDPGTTVVDWDGRDGHGRRLPAGVYFVRARIGERELTRRLVRVP